MVDLSFMIMSQVQPELQGRVLHLPPTLPRPRGSGGGRNDTSKWRYVIVCLISKRKDSTVLLLIYTVCDMRGLVPRAAPREGGGRLRQGRGQRKQTRGPWLQVCHKQNSIFATFMIEIQRIELVQTPKSQVHNQYLDQTLLYWQSVSDHVQSFDYFLIFCSLSCSSLSWVT